MRYCHACAGRRAAVKDVKRYFINAILMSVSALIMRSIGVAFNVYVTGKVGAEGMGVLSLVGSAYGFALTFATSGISLAVTRLCAETVFIAPEGEGERRLHRIITVSAVYALIFGGVAGGTLYFGADYIGTVLLGDKRCVISLRVWAVTLAPTALCCALSGYFNACRRVFKNAVTQIAGQAVRIAVTAAALIVLAPHGMEGALIAVALGGGVSEVGGFFITYALYVADKRRHYPRRTATDAKRRFEKSSDRRTPGTELSSDSIKDAARSLCSAALPVAFSSYIRSGLVTLEHILIPRGLAKSGESYAEALASYGTLHGMVMPVVLFPYAVLGSFSSLLVPELSLCRARGQTERIRHISKLVFRATLIFGIGTSGIMMTFSHELGMALYNSAEAGYYIKIIAPVIPIMYLDTAVDSMLKGLGQQLFCMRVNIIDAALSVVLVAILVPAWGVEGYAAVIIVSEIINAGASIWKLLAVADIEPELGRWLIKPLTASLLSSVAVRVLVNRIPQFYRVEGGVHVTLMIVATAALYVATLAITNAIGTEDCRYMRRVFAR